MTLDRGVALVTIDVELAWGKVQIRDGRDRRHDYATERDVIGRMLDCFGRHDVPATWAIVGHLFLDRCRAVDGVAHPDLPRPAHPGLAEDWFAVDPCSTLVDAPAYYGADIVTMIRASGVAHEIGCHSFSHLIAASCTPEVFLADLRACQGVAGGEALRSYVYARNEVAHVGLLGPAGFAAYRGHLELPPAGVARRMIELVRLGPRSAARPVRDTSGIWNIPPTYLLAPATRGRALPVSLWCRRPLSRVRQAVHQRSLFHLWFHPYNVTADPDRVLAALERIVAAMARHRDRGELDVTTMAGLADRLSAAPRPPADGPGGAASAPSAPAP